MHIFKQLTFLWSVFAVASFGTILLYSYGWSLSSYYLWLSALGVLSCVLGYVVWAASDAKPRAAVFIAIGLLLGQWWFWEKILHQLLFRLSGFAY